MGQLLSKNKQKLEDVRKQLKDEVASRGQRDEELKAKDRELQALKDQQTRTAKEADELRKKTQLLESRSTDLEKQNQEKLNGLQSSIKRNGEAADQQRQQLEQQVSSLTQERDKANSERDNHEIRAKALEYSSKRQQKALETAQEESSNSPEALRQRDALDSRRRELEAQTLSLTQERDLAKGERDKANSDRDLSDVRARALDYSHKREKKQAAEAAELKTAGVQQAHEALLLYHDHAKRDWTGLLLQLQYENDALRMQKQALHQSYNDVYALRYQVDALRMQKQALQKSYDDIYALRYQVDALRMQKQALQKSYDDIYALRYQVDGLRLQKQALMQSHGDLLTKYKGSLFEVAAVRESHRALGEYHRTKNLDSEAKFTRAQDEITASRQLHRDLQDHHNLTQKQLAAANKDRDTAQQLHAELDDAHRKLQKDSAEKFSKQQEELEASRQRLDGVQKDYGMAVKKHELEAENLRKQLKDSEEIKEQHRQTQAELSTQLQTAKANIERLEKESLERHDSATKIDSPQLPQTESISYNISNM